MKRESQRVRVGIVEDDAEFRDEIMLPGLRGAGIEAVGYGGAQAFHAVLARASFDVVVLDIGLPDGDGFTLASRLRATAGTGVIMLSALARDEDRIRALQAGADVYLCKPVTMQLLAANVFSLVRRVGESVVAGEGVRGRATAGRWRLDADDWLLVCPSGATLHLGAMERCVLRKLFADAGRVVARASLVEAMAEDPRRFDPHRLDVLVHRLRRRVSVRTGAALPLHTVRGQGYVLLETDADRRFVPGAGL